MTSTRNHFNNLKEELKSDYCSSQIAENSSSSSKLWKTLKSMMGKHQGSSEMVSLLKQKAQRKILLTALTNYLYRLLLNSLQNVWVAMHIDLPQIRELKKNLH